jgi:hypothetical protein
MKAQWTRKRWFVGLRDDTEKYEVFSCDYTPIRSTHGKVYRFCFGDYRTKREAELVKGYQSIPVYS